MSLQNLCGCHPHAGSRIDSVRAILGKELTKYFDAVVDLVGKGSDSDQLALFGCFAARKMLEAGCVAVLSRVDPARLLILREFQLKAQYTIDKRNLASIDWKSDVLSEKPAAWTENIGPSAFVRSLLGGHLAEVMWIAAIQELVGSEEDFAGSKWVEEIFAQYDERRTQLIEARQKKAEKRPKGGKEAPPEAAIVEESNVVDGAEIAIMASFRNNAQQVFSTLSKGVHLEFVVDQSTRFDGVTILEAMRLAVKLVTQIAFISHFMDSATGRLPAREAFALVMEIEKEIGDGI